MTLFRYIRSNGLRVPSEYETVEVDPDGRLAGWRSVAVGAVGSFEGRLPADRVADVRRAADLALTAAPPAGFARPDSATETIEIDDGYAVRVEAAGEADASWRALRDLGRRLLEVQVEFPVAAIGLDAEAGRLVHLGDHPLRIDLGGAVVEWSAVRSSGDVVGEAVEFAGADASGRGESGGDASGSESTGTVTTGPGWTAPLPVTPAAAAAGARAEVQLWVRFTIVASGRPVPVEVSTPPVP